MKRAVLVCGGMMRSPAFMSEYITAKDHIVAVDSGAKHLKAMGIVPHCYIGDMDSIDQSTFEYLKSQNVETEIFSSEKDSTDSQLAVERVIEKGYDTIILLGATGSRADHMTANIFLLDYMQGCGAHGMICDENNQILLMSDQKNNIKIKCENYFSLIPVSGSVQGITLKNAKYPLNDKTILRGDTLGLSNEAADPHKKVGIRITHGKLLVFISKDDTDKEVEKCRMTVS